MEPLYSPFGEEERKRQEEEEKRNQIVAPTPNAIIAPPNVIIPPGTSPEEMNTSTVPRRSSLRPLVTPDEQWKPMFLAPPDQKRKYLDSAWEIAKEHGPDFALMIGAYGASSLAIAATGGGALPAIALLGLRGVLSGALYGTVSSVIQGEENPDGVAKNALENALWFSAFDLATGGLGKIARPFTKKYWKPLADRVWNVLTLPADIKIPEAMSMLPSFIRGHSLRELITPAIDRLMQHSPKVGEHFKESRAQINIIQEIAGKLGKAVEDFTPVERFEILKLLRGSKEAFSPKVQLAYGKYINEIVEKDLSEKFARRYTQEFSRLLTKDILKPEVVMVGDTTRKTLQVLEQSFQKADHPSIRKALDTLMDDPLVSDEMRVLARDLYELPARIPAHATEASLHAGHSYLLSQLKNTPGVISATMKEGYVKSKRKGLQGLYTPRDVDLELEAMEVLPRLVNKSMQKWFVGPWKTAKVPMRPATHFRNLMSNTITNDWGGLPFYNVNTYGRALEEMFHPSAEWKNFSRTAGITGASYTKQEIHRFSSSWKKGQTIFDKMLNAYDNIAQPFARMYDMEEKFFKFAKYLHNRGLGMDIKEATWDAMKWTFNYGEITPFTAWTRTYAMPFFTWTSKAIPLMAHTAIHHPIRFGKWVAAFMYAQNKFVEKADLSDNQWDAMHALMPDYIKNGIYLTLPWRGERGEVEMLNLTYIIPGIGDVAELHQRGMKSTLQHPALSIITALSSNQKYSGSPIFIEWDSPQVKYMKSASYVFQQLMPPITPGPKGWGGVDFQLIMDAFDESEHVGWNEAVAAQFGLKVVKQHPDEIARRAAALHRIHETEAKQEMRRELRRATSAEEQRRILDKYTKILTRER